eukprot:gene21287-28211_t
MCTNYQLYPLSTTSTHHHHWFSFPRVYTTNWTYEDGSTTSDPRFMGPRGPTTTTTGHCSPWVPTTTNQLFWFVPCVPTPSTNGARCPRGYQLQLPRVIGPHGPNYQRPTGICAMWTNDHRPTGHCSPCETDSYHGSCVPGVATTSYQRGRGAPGGTNRHRPTGHGAPGGPPTRGTTGHGPQVRRTSTNLVIGPHVYQLPSDQLSWFPMWTNASDNVSLYPPCGVDHDQATTGSPLANDHRQRSLVPQVDQHQRPATNGAGCPRGTNYSYHCVMGPHVTNYQLPMAVVPRWTTTIATGQGSPCDQLPATTFSVPHWWYQRPSIYQRCYVPHVYQLHRPRSLLSPGGPTTIATGSLFPTGYQATSYPLFIVTQGTTYHSTNVQCAPLYQLHYNGSLFPRCTTTSYIEPTVQGPHVTNYQADHGSFVPTPCGPTTIYQPVSCSPCDQLQSTKLFIVPSESSVKGGFRQNALSSREVGGNDMLGGFCHNTLSSGETEGNDRLGGFRQDKLASGEVGGNDMQGGFGHNTLSSGETEGNDRPGGFRQDKLASGEVGGNDMLGGFRQRRLLFKEGSVKEGFRQDTLASGETEGNDRLGGFRQSTLSSEETDGDDMLRGFRHNTLSSEETDGNDRLGGFRHNTLSPGEVGGIDMLGGFRQDTLSSEETDGDDMLGGVRQGKLLFKEGSVKEGFRQDTISSGETEGHDMLGGFRHSTISSGETDGNDMLGAFRHNTLSPGEVGGIDMLGVFRPNTLSPGETEGNDMLGGFHQSRRRRRVKEGSNKEVFHQRPLSSGEIGGNDMLVGGRQRSFLSTKDSVKEHSHLEILKEMAVAYVASQKDKVVLAKKLNGNLLSCKMDN